MSNIFNMVWRWIGSAFRVHGSSAIVPTRDSESPYTKADPIRQVVAGVEVGVQQRFGVQQQNKRQQHSNKQAEHCRLSSLNSQYEDEVSV